MILADEVVVIAGVGPGLGAKLATRVAQEGAKVVMAARSLNVTEQVAKEITAGGGSALAIPCDVRNPDDVTALVTTAVAEFGPITGLVNSAYSHPGFFDLLETPDKALRRSLEIILHGSLTVTRAVVPHMKAAGHGSIVNVGTMTTRKPLRGEAAYAVAKSALSCASTYLALELGEHNIRVNQAIMGWLDGPGVRLYLKLTANSRGLTEEAVYNEIAARNPLGRIPTDDACTGPILFLLSPLASEITGATLDVNAGEFMPP